MRFRLAGKYKGVVIQDVSLSGGDGGGPPFGAFALFSGPRGAVLSYKL